MLANLFLSVADAVISYTIDKLDPAETLKTWLKLDPAKLAFQKALARTYTAFARQHPEYAASLFDQSFLNKEAVPEISKLLIRNQHPDPALLAQVWAKSIGASPEFASKATNPMADFLVWLEAELKREQAFQALFDSRALDSLPRIEAEIEKLTKELTRGLDAALKIASEYERITLKIQGDARDSNNIVGDGNQISVSNIYNSYYTGAFDKLNDFYIQPDSVFQRVRVDEFVGRDWLTAKVDAFLNDPSRKSGSFLLVGEAGVGKTSFMAHLVKERRYLHLFAEQVAGDANLQRALQSLGSQLVTHYQIGPYKDRDTLTQLAVFPDFLEKLLRLAASMLTNGEKIVIVCDALDEAGTFPDGNVFGLPNVLPDGVYFILSQRPVNTKLPNFEPLRFNLEAQGADNLLDMQTYLSAVSKRPEVAGQIRSKEYSEAFFIQILKEKSLGVWMYLHYIVKEIENGSRAPLDLENLPTGLIGYYADYWDDWRYGRKGRGKGEDAWNSLYSPLLTTLAAAQEAITVEQLIQWSNVKATPRQVSHLLNQSWRSFITEKEAAKRKIYSPYHLSFRDFITGKVDFEKLDPKRENLVRDLAEQTAEAHGHIVHTFEVECKGEWEKLVEQDYPRLHLIAHLAGAKEHKKLTNLLTEGDEKIKWAEAREKREETYAGYLNDLTYVWDYAERKQNYALAIRCMLIENSIHSLASHIPPELLAELAKTGLWSYARCLSTIRENSNASTQEIALNLIIPNLPLLLLQDALAVAFEIKDEYYRARALAILVPYLNDELKSQVLAATSKIKDEYDRISVLIALMPYLNEAFNLQVLADAREIKDEYDRARALTALAPYINGELKSQVLEDGLAGTREIEDEYSRVHVLTVLIPHLNEELRLQVLQEELAAVCEMKDESRRAFALADLAPHLNEKLKLEVLAFARKIKDESYRSSALVALVPYLNEKRKLEVLDVTRKIKDEHSRACALTALALHLNGELKAQVLKEGLVTAREIKHDTSLIAALVNLAPYCNDEVKLEVLAVIREFKDQSYQTNALTYLAPHLGEELKLVALDIAREIKEDYRARALGVLAPHLSGELKSQVLKEALFAAHEIKDGYSRILALTNLAQYLNQVFKSQVLKEGLAVAREIKDEKTRVNPLAAIAPLCNDELKLEVLDVAREIKDENTRARALIYLVPHLNGELKLQVLKEDLVAVREIKDEGSRAYTLTTLAPLLNGELESQVLQESLVVAREIKDEYARARALTALAPHLNGELKSQVLQESLVTAREIKGESSRAYALTALAPHLNGELKSQVLQESLVAAREIKDESSRARVLIALAPHFNGELKSQVLQESLVAARKIKHDIVRADILADLVPHLDKEVSIVILQEILFLPEFGRNARGKIVLNIWKEIGFEGLDEYIDLFVRFTSQKDREEGLDALDMFVPALIHFRGTEIVPELYRTVMDTARWWP